ncbi:hypothetical protein KCU92_g9142, partial [Aureobasidium melanogenum]
MIANLASGALLLSSLYSPVTAAAIQEYTANMDDCIDLCDSTPGCVAVSRSGKACYLKNRINTATTNSGVVSARIFVLNGTAAGHTSYISCPSWNNTLYNDTVTGTSWKVECDLNHQGGDLGLTYASSLEQCAKQCDLAPGCVSAVYQGNACYQKRSIGKASQATGLLGYRSCPEAQIGWPLLNKPS